MGYGARDDGLMSIAPIIILVGIAPGAFYLWYVYHLDVYEPEPKKLVLKTFLYGIFFAFGAAWVEQVILNLILFPGHHLNHTISNPLLAQLPWPVLAFFCFIVVGPVEEFAKYYAVVKVLTPQSSPSTQYRKLFGHLVYQKAASIYDSPDFNEPMDGIVYASAAALGFATLETIGDLFIYGIKGIIARAFLAVPAHLLFSCFWGYGLGKGVSNPEARKEFPLWFGAGALAHGLWDFSIFFFMSKFNEQYFGVLLDFVFLIGMYFWARKKVRWAEEVSPFKEKALHLFKSQIGGLSRASENKMDPT
jgi:RsiW-degrading membrane proteinase PrsW (M82 family)